MRPNVPLLCTGTKYVHNICFFPLLTLFYRQSAQVNAQKQKGQGANASDNAVKFLKVS
jgi:hypothetical protein